MFHESKLTLIPLYKQVWREKPQGNRCLPKTFCSEGGQRAKKDAAGHSCSFNCVVILISGTDSCVISQIMYSN